MLTLKDLQELKDPGPPPEKPPEKRPPYRARGGWDDLEEYSKWEATVVVWNQWVKHRRCYLMAQDVLRRVEQDLDADGVTVLLVTLIEHLGLGESGRILSDIGLVPFSGQ